MSYDHWKTSNPYDEWLSSAPQSGEEEEEEQEGRTTLGWIITESKASMEFWVATFGLERQVAAGAAGLMGKKGKAAVIPVVGSCRVASELVWLYVFAIQVDVLGVSGGLGIVYCADSRNEDKLRELRDKDAEAIMEKLHSSGAPEIVFVEL